MKTAKLLTFFVLLTLHFQIFSCSYSDDFIASPIELTDQTFIRAVRTNNYFVMFYSSMHSVPNEYNMTLHLLAELYNDGPSSEVKIACFDCIENPILCEKKRIKTRKTNEPILKIFKAGINKGIKYTSLQINLYYIRRFIIQTLNLSKELVPQNILPPQKVVELTNRDSSWKIKKGKWLVNFYIPECIHALNLLPIWDKFASKLKPYIRELKINVGKVNCDKLESICDEFKIKSSPTILLVEEGKIIDTYREERTVKLLNSYLENKYKKPSGIIDSMGNILYFPKRQYKKVPN